MIAEYRVEGRPNWLIAHGAPEDDFEALERAIRRQIPDVVEVRRRDEEGDEDG